MPQYLEPGARVSERWSPGRCVTVELREPPAITEDPMTEDRMALVELLQKSGDGDFLRAVADAVLQIRMEADVKGLIGACRHERTGAGSLTVTATAIAASIPGSDHSVGAFPRAFRGSWSRLG